MTERCKCIIDNEEYCQSGCCDCIMLGIATKVARDEEMYYNKVRKEVKE